jgi:hypothetical protein
MMSNLPNGLEVNAMIAAVAWGIVNLAYVRTAYFSEKPYEDVLVTLTNEFIRVRQAIYHGKIIRDRAKGK